MIKKLKKLLATFTLTVMFAVPAMPLGAVHAQTEIENGLNCGASLNASGIGDAGTECAVDAENPGQTVDDIIELVINVFSLIVGVVSVIMIIIGGLKYITSGGDSGNITGAKNTILYAIIGLVVVALAQVVVKFVLQKTGESIQ